MKTFIILIIGAVIIGNVLASELKEVEQGQLNTVSIYNAQHGTNY